MKKQTDVIEYIISFLSGRFDGLLKIDYSNSYDNKTDICIIPSSLFELIKQGKTDDIYRMILARTETPVMIGNEEGIPCLFGDKRIEEINGTIVVYADVVASSFFFMSRYEEVLVPEKRDAYGRFLYEHSILKQYIDRPVVDDYARFLQGIIKKRLGVDEKEEEGFSKIYLTHDLDMPLRDRNFLSYVKHLTHSCDDRHLVKKGFFKSYLDPSKDQFYTYPWIIQQDRRVVESYGKEKAESVFFLICHQPTMKNRYYSYWVPRYKRILDYLINENEKIGIHISLEGGADPKKIKKEIRRFPYPKENRLYSRHHFLRWREPEHIREMENAGITDDFSLYYADRIGFRVGTCHAYRFIDPISLAVTGVTVHPLAIMESTLNSSRYMGLDYQNALKKSKGIIDEVFRHGGELNLLFHNHVFAGKEFDYKKLYKELMDYVISLNKSNQNGKCDFPLHLDGN